MYKFQFNLPFSVKFCLFIRHLLQVGFLCGWWGTFAMRDGNLKKQINWGRLVVWDLKNK